MFYAGTREEADAIRIGTGNTQLSGAVWHCTDGDSEGIGASSGSCGSKLSWALSSDGTLTISGSGAMSNYTSSSGTPWEARKSTIKTVVLNSGVTTLGDYAFAGCSNLSAIQLPNGLKSIGEYAVNNCDALASITIPDSVTSIAYRAFSYCDALTSIVIPDSVSSIGGWAFEASGLTDVTLSKGLTEIPNGCFNWCDLTEINIPEGVATIGESAFYHNSRLSKVYLPHSIESIASSAFNSCSSLSDVFYAGTREEADAIRIGTGNANLTGATWHFSTSPQIPLKTLSLPGGLTTIEAEAFANAAAQKIVIPSAVTAIESKAFANSPNLVMLYFEGSPDRIAQDILYGCSNVVIDVLPGTNAEAWALASGFQVQYHSN